MFSFMAAAQIEKPDVISVLKKLKFCVAALFAVCLISAGNVAFAAPICPVPTSPAYGVMTR